MGKNQSASNLTNIIQQDADGSIKLMHGSTMLMQVSSSGAITTTGVISGSNALSASYAATSTSASYAVASTSASYAVNSTSASYAISATTSSYADAFTVAGTLTAQTLVVQTITSSVDFVTGSTRFGSLLTNTHVFSGSISMNPGGLFVSSSGNVGIGTVSPSGILDVQKNQNATTAFYFRNTDTIDANSRAYLNVIAGSSALTLAVLNAGDTYIAGTSGKDMYFQQNIGGTVNMIIKSSGNIGIGTNNPVETSNYIFTTTNGTNGSGYITKVNGTTALYSYSNSTESRLAEQRAMSLIFETSGTERLRITSDGKLKLTSTTSGGTNLDMYLLENDGLYINSNESTTSRNIYFQTGGTQRMSITSEGINITPGLVYSTDLTYNSDWAVNFQTVVPTGTLGGNKVYLFTIWTSSFGTPPYYAAASGIITTASNTNSGGNGPEITLLTSHHVSSTSTWQIRMTTAGNSTNGVQVKLLNGPSASGTAIYVRVSLLSSF